MPRFIDPRGHATFGIGICGRCSLKPSLDDLIPDAHSPGFVVCAPWIKEGCWDVLDPYRLPARQTEQINLPCVRPDESLYPVAGPSYDTTVWLSDDEGNPLVLYPGGNWDSGTWILVTVNDNSVAEP